MYFKESPLKLSLDTILNGYVLPRGGRSRFGTVGVCSKELVRRTSGYAGAHEPRWG